MLSEFSRVLTIAVEKIRYFTTVPGYKDCVCNGKLVKSGISHSHVFNNTCENAPYVFFLQEAIEKVRIQERWNIKNLTLMFLHTYKRKKAVIT